MEDEMVGWHHQLDGHESEQTLGVGDGQGAWCAVVHGVTKSRTRLCEETTICLFQMAIVWSSGTLLFFILVFLQVQNTK